MQSGRIIASGSGGSALSVKYELQDPGGSEEQVVQVHATAAGAGSNSLMLSSDLFLETADGYASARGNRPVVRSPKLPTAVPAINAGASAATVLVARYPTYDLVIFTGGDSESELEVTAAPGGSGSNATFTLTPGQQLRVYATSVSGPSAVVGDESLKPLFLLTLANYQAMQAADPTGAWYDPLSDIRSAYENASGGGS